MVTVVVTGAQEVRSITIKPEVVNPEDIELLQDMILAAVTEALQKSKDLAEERMGALTGGMGLRIMRYRAKMIAGQLNIRSRPGGGTVISCSCALQPSPSKPTYEDLSHDRDDEQQSRRSPDR